ncbi:MAG: DUF1805 domain-containing protein [archaeon]
MNIDLIKTKKGNALGIKIPLQKKSLILILGEKGYLACSYFDKETIEKLGDCAALFSGVEDFWDILKKKPTYVSQKALKLGINYNMKGKDILEVFV